MIHFASAVFVVSWGSQCCLTIPIVLISVQSGVAQLPGHDFDVVVMTREWPNYATLALDSIRGVL